MRDQDQRSDEPTLTRRALLASGGAVGVGLAFPWVASAHLQRTRSHLRRSSYQPLIGEQFRIGATPVKLRLTHVADLNRHQAGSERAFALGFAAPWHAPPLATNAAATLHHPALGRFTLLLAPGAPSGRGVRYWAVINRIRA